MPHFIRKRGAPFSERTLKRLVVDDDPAIFEVTESHADQVLRRQDVYQEIPSHLFAGAEDETPPSSKASGVREENPPTRNAASNAELRRTSRQHAARERKSGTRPTKRTEPAAT